MRPVAIACVAISVGQAAHARDVTLVLNWDEAAPATEIVAVARDNSGAVLESQRLNLPENTQETVLPLPSLSRQATTLQVGALVGGVFALQSPRIAVEGGQPPDRVLLNAALTAGFSTEYLCASGQVLTLRMDGEGFVTTAETMRSFRPTGLDGRYTAEDGTYANLIPGLLQLEGTNGTLLESCQPIPSRPLLPLEALGPEKPAAQGWKVVTRLDGSVLSLPDAAVDSATAAEERLPSTIVPMGDDALRIEIGAHALNVTPEPCQFPVRYMTYPFSATLMGPGAPFSLGCAGDPLLALEGGAWQVTHLLGHALPHGTDAAPALTLQVDTGRLSGRTSCNRYLGRAAVTDQHLNVRDLGTTRLVCAVNLSNLEARFLDALEAADDILRLNDGRVALYAGPTAVMMLER